MSSDQPLFQLGDGFLSLDAEEKEEEEEEEDYSTVVKTLAIDDIWC